jgi:hypothetical protein
MEAVVLGQLLLRYLAGECEEVWAELLKGADRAGNPIPLADAEAVAYETMRRTRRNLETIVAHLTASGYQFAAEFGPLVDPPTNTKERIAELERLGGPIPVALKAFWEIVGSVDLVPERVSPSWTHFQGIHLRPPYLDPLQVWPMEEVWGEYEDAIEYHKERQSGEDISYSFTFSSDPETKAGFGGGLLLSMELPDAGHDTTIYFEDTDTGEQSLTYEEAFAGVDSLALPT